MTSEFNPAILGEPMSLTAVVSVNTPGAGTPTGTVTWTVGSANLGTASVSGGLAVLSVTPPANLGINKIVAVYSGDSNSMGSTSAAYTQIVQGTTSTTVTSNLNPSLQGQLVTLTATVTSSMATATGAVTFRDGSAVLGAVPLNGSNTATYATGSLTGGSHTITAVYGGDVNFQGDVSGPCIQLVNSTLPFSDDFNRPDAPNLGSNYAQATGSLAIQLGQVAANPGINLALYTGAVPVNVTVQADVDLTVSGSAQAGLVARYTGPGDSNMYLGQLVGTNGSFSAAISRNVAGAWTILTQAPVATGTGTLCLEVLGNSLNLYLNGALVASALDNLMQGPGLAGMRAGAASLDNFSANTLNYQHSFVNALYQTFLGRSGSATELSFWVGAVPAIGRAGVDQGIIRSFESYNRLVEDLFVTLLGRQSGPRTPAGYRCWCMAPLRSRSSMASSARRSSPPVQTPHWPMPQEARIRISSRPSMWSCWAGPRVPLRSNSWTSFLPTVGKAGVDMAFLQSPEFRGNVIRTLYSGNTTLPATSFIGIVPNLLPRTSPPSAAEVTSWLNTNLDLLSLEVEFAASTEFFDVATRIGGLSGSDLYVNSLYQVSLERNGSPSELSSWVGAVPAIGRAGVAQNIICSSEGFNRLVEDLYVTLLGGRRDRGRRLGPDAGARRH